MPLVTIEGLDGAGKTTLAAGLSAALPHAVLLRIGPAAGRARQSGRGEEPDRLEQEADAFFARIAAAYDELAAAEPARFLVLDAARPPEGLVADALAAVSELDG